MLCASFVSEPFICAKIRDGYGRPLRARAAPRTELRRYLQLHGQRRDAPFHQRAQRRQPVSPVHEGQRRSVAAAARVRAAARAAARGDSSSERSSRYDDVIRASTLDQIPKSWCAQSSRSKVITMACCLASAPSGLDAAHARHGRAHAGARYLLPAQEDPWWGSLFAHLGQHVQMATFKRLTIAGYNAEENAVVKHGGIPP